MPAYLAFGLRIQSERELPDGVLTDPTVGGTSVLPDVTIRWSTPADEEARPSKPNEPDSWYEFAEGVHRFGWPELGYVEIFSGRDVVVHPAPRVAAGLVEHVLLGPIMADILFSTGMVPLHASAVCVADGAVAFVGPSGHGKSTLAAAMHRAGYRAHADDLLGVPAESEPLVAFGISRIKLNPDSARFVGDDPSGMPAVYEGIDKRTKVVAQAELPVPRPLRAVYRLGVAEEISLRRVEPRKAMFDLYANCFRVEVAQHAQGAQEILRRCATIAQGVPVFELKRPKDFAQLDRVVQQVAEHAGGL